ncbi:hypothetical protein CASFOL_031480 [Castilleja foliolosa]|uniref:Cytochrome b561 domain-containing protein n=1 Tax=Castilleja foliolosa TaxID=1961234 RepID=A0ABD3C7R3_9LAMI
MSPVSNLCGLALLFLVDFAESSFNEQNEAEIHHNSSNSQIHQVISERALDIQVHGVLLWASMGFLMPVGILAMRISSCTKDLHPSSHKFLFYIHAISQFLPGSILRILGSMRNQEYYIYLKKLERHTSGGPKQMLVQLVLSVIIITIGAILSIRNFENAFKNAHQRIGLALYGAIYLQIGIGFKRPKRGSRFRRTWYFLHWLQGTTICLVGILNIYTGLQAYHKRTSKSTTLWSVVFTAQVSFMVIIYLLQEKWEYIFKQGVIAADNDINSSAAELESQTKEGLDEPSRKSNALGSYFSRTNALNKLFQLT